MFDLVQSGLTLVEIAWVMGDAGGAPPAGDGSEELAMRLIRDDLASQESERVAAELVAAEFAAFEFRDDGAAPAGGTPGGAIFEALVGDGMPADQAAAIVAMTVSDDGAAAVAPPSSEDVAAAAAAEVAFEAEAKELAARRAAIEAGETGARPDIEGLPRCPHCGRAIEVLAANCRIFVCAYNPRTEQQWGPHDEAGALASDEALVGCRKQMQLTAGGWMVRCTGK